MFKTKVTETVTWVSPELIDTKSIIKKFILGWNYETIETAQTNINIEKREDSPQTKTMGFG